MFKLRPQTMAENKLATGFSIIIIQQHHVPPLRTSQVAIKMRYWQKKLGRRAGALHGSRIPPPACSKGKFIISPPLCGVCVCVQWNEYSAAVFVG